MTESLIDITKDTTLQEIEDRLIKLRPDSPVSIRLPRHHYKNFFKDTWLASLIANAAVTCGHLTIRDWKDSEMSEMQRHFASSLVGILAAYMAQQLETNAHKKADIDVHGMIEQIIHRKRGLIEEIDIESNEFQGNKTARSFTFLTVDGEESGKGWLSTPRPMVLSAGNKNEFIDKFLRIKREHIDRVFDLKPQLSLFDFDRTFEYERNFAELIYELYDNTTQHGRFDENNNLIKGVRSFNIKKHIGSIESVTKQAESFEVLKTYFGQFNEHKEVKLYEICISDNGLGVINRFLSSRPDYKEAPEFMNLSSIEQLNYIIDKSLSSKLFPGAGKGIRTALSIIKSMKGFLTLRTNDCWVYYSGMQDNQSLYLKDVPYNKKVANIRGTTYNILLPVL
jgi:hypothetical protein